jgi:hypothetical protein
MRPGRRPVVDEPAIEADEPGCLNIRAGATSGHAHALCHRESAGDTAPVRRVDRGTGHRVASDGS